MLTSPVSLPPATSGYELASAANLPADEAAAAKKLEGLFLSMLIKEMRETSTEEGLFPGDDAGIHGSIFDTMMGEFLAEQEAGLGISRYVLAAKDSDMPADAAQAPETSSAPSTE